MEEFEFIRHLILKDYPQFQKTTHQWNTDGWDNMVLVLDEQVVFRIPRNEVSSRQLLVELEVLPQIAAVSPLPVPMYAYFSEEPGVYAGYEMIPGQPFERDVFSLCTKNQRKEAARLLGSFLGELHGVNVYKIKQHNPSIRRQNRQTWLDLHAEVLNKASDVLQPVHKQEIEKMFDYILKEIDFDALPKTIIHGDLSSDHILYNANRKRISGIIDFGDLMIGDPAYDFTGILLNYGREFLDVVLENYVPPRDDCFLERLERFYVPKVPLHSLLFGIEQGNSVIVSQALEENNRQIEKNNP